MRLNISLQLTQEWNRENPGRKALSLAILSQKEMNVPDPSREIGIALLDQQVITGVGNILRVEILF